MLFRFTLATLLAAVVGGAAASPLLAQDTTRVSVGDKDAEGLVSLMTPVI